jgi:hypothetical protein
MKRLSLKQLLVMVFIGLLTMSGATLGGGPNGNGICGGQCGTGNQYQEQNQFGRDDLLGVFESGGQCGTGNQYQEQNQYGRDGLLQLNGNNCGGCEHHQYHWAGGKPE